MGDDPIAPGLLEWSEVALGDDGPSHVNIIVIHLFVCVSVCTSIVPYYRVLEFLALPPEVLHSE